MTSYTTSIIFDISEVLLTGIKDTGIALAEKHQLTNDLNHTVGWTAIRTPLLIPLAEELFYGNIDEDEYIAAVLKAYPQLGTAVWLKQHIRDNFREVEGTRKIIIKLRQLGYRLALLSVHAKEWVDYCEEKFNFHGLFDVHIYSFNTKVSKPHPASFQAALYQLRSKPEECLFIDDSTINVEAARALGIPSVVFITATDLEVELKKLLPNF